MTTASIVAYNTPTDELAKVLDCLKKAPIDKVYIIDNSSNPTTEVQVASDPFVDYIKAENRGYGAGHNIGIRKAIAEGAKYHIIMNSDVYWDEGTIERCIDYMNKNVNVGQLMPNVFYPDGSQQYQCKLIPTPLDLLLKRFLPQSVKKRRLKRFQLEFTGYDHIMNVPYLSGCFMMMRVSALKEVGLFDERFFMYPEDIDLTRRMHERYLTIFYPAAHITHVYAVSSRKNLRMFVIHAINMIKYFNKWGWIFDKKRDFYNSQLLKSEGYDSQH